MGKGPIANMKHTHSLLAELQPPTFGQAHLPCVYPLSTRQHACDMHVTRSKIQIQVFEMAKA